VLSKRIGDSGRSRRIDSGKTVHNVVSVYTLIFGKPLRHHGKELIAKIVKMGPRRITSIDGEPYNPRRPLHRAIAEQLELGERLKYSDSK
jgi:hypothetical protein